MIRQFRPLLENMNQRSIRAGSIILYQGEVPRSACILTEGVVRVYSISPQGEDQIVAFHVSGEFFPTSWIFSKSPGTLFFYEAVTDCKIAFIPRETLIDYIFREPARTRAIFEYFATNYVASLIQVNALEQAKARDKLVHILYYLCQRYAKEQTSEIHIPITLTHQTIASMVGLTRETTAMEMSRLKKEAVISYSQQQYTVSTKKLFALMGEDTFQGLSIVSE